MPDEKELKGLRKHLSTVKGWVANIMSSKKELKKLNKHLVLAIDWVAAEYKYLEDLKKELAEIENEKSPRKVNKELKKAVSLTRYIGRAERRANRFEKEIGKELHQLDAKLSHHTGEEVQIKELVTCLRTVLKEFSVEESHLVKYASLYQGHLKKELKQAQIEEKLFEKIQKDHPKKAEQVHHSFLSLIKQIETEIENTEKWVFALEASFKKAQKLVKKYHEGTNEDNNHLIKEGYAILKKHEFPITRFPEYALFLAKHPHDLREMADAVGRYTESLFLYGLPAVKGLLEKKILSWEEVVSGVVKMADAAGKNARFLFYRGLPAVKGLLEKKILSWEEVVSGFVKMADAAVRYTGSLFLYGLPAVKGLLEKKILFWEEVVSGVVKMANAAGKNARFLFYRGLPAVKGLLEEQIISWEEVVSGLPKMADAAGKNTGYLFEDGLHEVKGLLEEQIISWEQVVSGFVKMADAAGKNAGYLFVQGLPAVKGLLAKENWEDFVQFFCYVGKSKQKIEQMVQIFKHLDSKSKTFLLYLIQTRPKKTLEVFNKYHLLKILEINYEPELNLFLKIASPITFKEKNFAGLTSILIPLNKLSPQYKNKFLKFLDNSILTFQGTNIKFIKLLQATEGFEDINSYSFINLVYIYLKYFNNPGIKVKNLKKQILKLQKNEKNCLNLIDNKNKLEDLNETQINRFKSNLKSISDKFYDLLLALYTESSHEKIANNLEKMFKIKIKHIGQKIEHKSFQNALHVLKKLEHSNDQNYQLCYNLIKNYLEGKTYPLTKNILKSYPWNLSENQAWYKAHLKNSFWVKDFHKKYKSGAENVKKTNVESRITHHLQQSKNIFVQLGIEVEEFNLANIQAKYKQIAKQKDKYDSGLVSDLKTQISALKSLMGQRQAEIKSGKTIIIQPEFDPLEILQMGNHVQGSCLATAGVNYWSTVTNAVEINKRVLWAKDESGQILARLLIAVDENNKLLRFPIYYATNIDMTSFFNDYLKELANKCGFGLNGNEKNVKKILSKKWYEDPVEEIV